GDDAIDDLVGHQVAAVHDFLDRQAQRCPVGDGRAEDVASRELRNAVGLDQDLGLGTLADTRRSEQDQSHRRLPPSRDFLTSPSYSWAMRWLCTCVIVSSVTVTMISSE